MGLSVRPRRVTVGRLGHRVSASAPQRNVSSSSSWPSDVPFIRLPVLEKSHLLCCLRLDRPVHNPHLFPCECQEMQRRGNGLGWAEESGKNNKKKTKKHRQLDWLHKYSAVNQWLIYPGHGRFSRRTPMNVRNLTQLFMTREVWKSIKTPNALKWPPLPFAASGSQNKSSFLLGKSWIWNGPRRRVAAAWINHQHASGSPILGCKYRKHILWLLIACTFLKEIHCDIVVVCNTNLRFQNMSLLGLRGVILMFRICLSSAYISNKSKKNHPLIRVLRFLV